MFKKNIPINITGGSYQSRTRPLSSQETRNFYHMVVEQGKEQYILHSFPGLNHLATATIGADRGITSMAGVGYRVVGSKLYSFTQYGVHTEIGAIGGNKRCIFANDGVNLIIVCESVYIYDGSTVSTISDVDIIGSTAVTFLNNQMIYTNDNLFVVASPGIPNVASGLDAAAAESKPDDLVRAYAFQQSVYMFGETTCEPWWNTGSGNPPFERIDGQIFEVGCGAIHSIAHTDEYLYWLGDDKAVYAASGGAKKRISSVAISHAIETYDDTSDAHGYTFTFEGMNFYMIHFPTAEKTWCINESLGEMGWFQVSSGTSGGQYQGTSLTTVYNKNFVADTNNGRLYELDISTFTNNSDIIQRRRVTSSVNGKLLGAPGERIQMSRLEIIMEAGVGLITGQGSIPKLMIDISYDGGRSWVSKGFVKVGQLGESTLRVELYCLDSFTDAIFRITTSDAVPFEIYSATIDLRLAGR